MNVARSSYFGHQGPVTEEMPAVCRQGAPDTNLGHLAPAGGVQKPTHTEEGKGCPPKRAAGCMRVGCLYCSFPPVHGTPSFLLKEWSPPPPLKSSPLLGQIHLFSLKEQHLPQKRWLFVVTVYCTLCMRPFFPIFTSSAPDPVLTCCAEFYQASLSNAPCHWV